MTVVPPNGGEVIGDSPDRRVEILCDDDAMNVTVSRFGPGPEGAACTCTTATATFYVLDGELTVRLGLEDEQRTVPEGSLARVPPDVVHGFRNASGNVMRYLTIHAPGCVFATYMRGLRDGVNVSYDPPADGGRPITLAEVSGDDELIESEALRVTRAREISETGGPVAYFALEGDLEIGWQPAAVARPCTRANTGCGLDCRVVMSSVQSASNSRIAGRSAWTMSPKS